MNIIILGENPLHGMSRIRYALNKSSGLDNTIINLQNKYNSIIDTQRINNTRKILKKCLNIINYYGTIDKR